MAFRLPVTPVVTDEDDRLSFTVLGPERSMELQLWMAVRVLSTQRLCSKVPYTLNKCMLTNADR